MVAIVDDDDAVREALSDLLLVLGVSCRSFDRAEVFLEEYVPGVFDCLIADVRMPGIDGLELQQQLRALDSTMPVIFVTSVTDPTTRVRALERGAHAYLTKPIAGDVLQRCLKSALDGDDFPSGGDRGENPPDE
jgi:FixJ family two-component response regulator